jgi:hypothetical protein
MDEEAPGRKAHKDSETTGSRFDRGFLTISFSRARFDGKPFSWPIV